MTDQPRLSERLWAAVEWFKRGDDFGPHDVLCSIDIPGAECNCPLAPFYDAALIPELRVLEAREERLTAAREAYRDLFTGYRLVGGGVDHLDECVRIEQQFEYARCSCGYDDASERLMLALAESRQEGAER